MTSRPQHLLAVKHLLLLTIVLSGPQSCSLEDDSVYPPIKEQARRCRNGFPLSDYKVKLRPAAINLLNEVETKFAKGVCMAEMKNWPPERYGDSDVDNAGTPFIRINPIFDDEERERTIVHEL